MVIRLDYDSSESDARKAISRLIEDFRSGRETLHFIVMETDEADQAEIISADISGIVE